MRTTARTIAFALLLVACGGDDSTANNASAAPAETATADCEGPVPGVPRCPQGSSSGCDEAWAPYLAYVEACGEPPAPQHEPIEPPPPNPPMPADEGEPSE
ncbi:MAG: hypothetical protein KC619_14260 [Myxococcales bacterium]|nr:hypothetical protein [Myxococcales bacterium]